MAKYHINSETGEVGKCSASQGKCPFGAAEEHYATLADANAANEQNLEELHGSGGITKPAQAFETAKEASRKNTAVRRVLSKLSREEKLKIVGGYLDLEDSVELSPEFIKRIDDFSELSDSTYDNMMKRLDALSMKKREDQTAAEAFLRTAELQKEDGFKNEYVLAAALAQYEDVEVYFPTGNIKAGGKPKVDMVVSIAGEKFPLSVKKTNGTQIETYTSRKTVGEITPGKKVIAKIEETSNRIFYFRPKFQAFAPKPGEREKLRTLKDGTPKLAGASIRIEYEKKSKLPKGRPTLPEESAIVAFGGVTQTDPIAIHDYGKKDAGILPTSSAHIFVVGDFSKLESIADAPNPKELLSEGMAISRKGVRSKDYAVTLRVSSMGNRTGDWVTDPSHITDSPKVTLSSYRAKLKSVTD